MNVKNESRLRVFLRRITSAGNLPTDTEQERLRKETLVFAVVGVIIAGTLWGLMYFALGLTLSGSIPFGYAVVSTINLIVYVRNKRYQLFQTIQLSSFLILPVVLQWSLGGFAAGSAVIIWALFCPLAALMFRGRRESIPWFVGLLVLLAVSGLLDPIFSQNPAEMPRWINTTFFVMNIGTSFGIMFTALLFFVRERDEARERSEFLLLNILPQEIADRLKREPGTIADSHPEASILFADIVGFTPLSSQLGPVEMIEVLNQVYSGFDDLVDKYGVEKIRTIGDNYMVAAGIPTSRADHVEALANLALDMLEFCRQLPPIGDARLNFRIGINTGPLTAGVIGNKKFHYDIWGDAVNTASRMESHGLPGRIQVTDEVATILKDAFVLEPRGMIEIKGKGKMQTWFLTERISHATTIDNA